MNLICAIVTWLLLLTVLHVLLFPSQDESHGVLLLVSHTLDGTGSHLEIVMGPWEQVFELHLWWSIAGSGYYTRRSTKLKGGILVSSCPSVHHQATSKGVSRVKFFIQN